ncbi:MAG: Thymidylate kinase [Lentisphaerae bacterium ADurb.BinA184]|nr:MAG: Thymidylate kinase [Lentisphaerae bacterium ADurb.BinA184]
MLEKLDLDAEVDKEAYRAERDKLELELGSLQRRARELGIPVLIVFEGWGASGKGVQINHLITPLDPRGFTVYASQSANEEISLRPFLWRFWVQTPARGRIAIFDRSWYRRVLQARVSRDCRGRRLEAAFQDILSFERQLADDGALIIKFFLHISKREQKRRFRKLEKGKSTAWRVRKADWEQNHAYRKYAAAVEDVLARTDSDIAPWNLIPAHQEEYAALQVLENTVRALRERCARVESGGKAAAAPVPKPPRRPARSALSRIDLTQTLARELYETRLDKRQQQLRDLQFEVYRRRIPVVILFEGWDAAGKGGAIKRLTRELDPRGYEVVPISAPTDGERAHHYLWRFWRHIPRNGRVAIFDRTWYGRVLVERVDGFCPESDWRRAYAEINEMEQNLASFGTVLVKFWLHIDADEQLRRFKDREADPNKQWKITQDDWHNRERRAPYESAIDEMIRRTSTACAPWTVVEANCKLFARVKVLETTIAAIRGALGR